MVASVAAMQSHSPSHFKPAGLSSSTTTTTTTMTKKQQQQQQQQQQSRVRQRSNEERHHSNTDNMVTKASLEDDIRRMTENFEDEVRIHRADLERSITLAQQQLAQRLDEITPAIVDSLADMTFKQFVEVYACDLYAAVRAIRLGTVVAEANDEINRTIKKRKRIATAGSESANNTAATEEDAFHAGSPMKSRKNMRMAPPTPKMLSSQTNAFPRSASRPGLLSSSNTAASRASQHSQQAGSGSAPTQVFRGAGGSTSSSSRFSNAASKQRASTSSNAGNVIYKARPSLTVPTNFNGPRLPQTPKAFGGASGTGSLGTARTAGKSTARRMPRKHETIQAYSTNGSPLGMFDLAVEQATAALSADAATTAPSSQSGAEEDWEILSNKTSVSQSAAAPVASTSTLPSLTRQTSNTPLAKISPSKLGRKPSHSAFKDKILAGATKAFGGGSHIHNRLTSPAKQQSGSSGHAPPSASSSGYSLARPPTREEFTFQTTPALPSIPSQSNVTEKWEAMKADLAKMCPDPEQRKLFEQRYLEIMHAS